MFIQFYKKKPEVVLLTYGLTKLVTETLQGFGNVGAMDSWRLLFVSLLTNFHHRKLSGRGSIRDNYQILQRSNEVQSSSELLQNRAMRDIKELGEASGFTRLACFPQTIDSISAESRKADQDDIGSCLNMIRGFLVSVGSSLDFNFLDNSLKALIDGQG